MKKEVLVDTFHLLKDSTGIKTYAVELCLAAEGFPSDAFNYRFSLPWRKVVKSSFFKGRQSLVKKIFYHFLYFFWKQVFLPIKVSGQKCDVLICPDYVVPIFGAKKLNKVVVLHDVFFWEYRKSYSVLWRKYFTRMVELGIAQKNTLSITVSNYSKKKILEYLNPSRLEVVYPSVQFSRILSYRSVEATKSNKSKYILHIGYFDKRKNLVFLVRVFKRFLEVINDQNIRLILIGRASASPSTNDYNNVLGEIKKLGIESQVICPGYLSNADVDFFFKSTLFYVFPSLDEGFGMPIIEAMKRNIPVLASTAGAIPEIGGDAALYFNPNNEEDLLKSMIELYKNTELRNELTQKGIEQSNLFTRRQFFSSLEEQISSIL